MKAWVLAKNGVIDDLAIAEVEKPKARPGEVLVRVRGAAVNPADLKVISGRDGGKFLHARNFPFAIGFDFAGDVAEVGAGASMHEPGAQVFGFLPYSGKNRQGSFAEYVAVPETDVGRMPTSLDYAQAASIATTGSTALQGLRDLARLAGSHRVLVNGGSGGVGSYAVQIAKRAGAEVWATCSARNVEFVADLGADRVIDYRQTPWSAIGEDADGGPRQRFDIVFDAASVSSYGASASLMSERATYVTMLPSFSWVTGKLRSALSSRSCKFVIVKAKRADLDHLAELIESEKVRALVAETYDVADLPAALQRLADGKVQGKLAVRVDFKE